MQNMTDVLPLPKVPLHFFNTETRKKEEFKPLYDNVVRMYTCGPTVYHYVHIGNLRTFVFEDILRRTLKFFGYSVIQAMNITDIDDKTIRGATEKKLKLIDFTNPYQNAFFVDIGELGIEKVEFYPRATDYINHMIDFINKLLDKGIAYKSKDKSIYYSIEKFPQYGRLSHLKLEELKAGAGETAVNADEYDKEQVSDFVLWKAYDEKRDGSIFWDSPFGPGRPGWHLECSTMAHELLGETLDIHVGGVDNIFPHHENEIAQSESFTGKTFAKLWMHAEHLLVNHKKMSKSLGNFYTLRDLLPKGYSGIDVRYMLMHTHYRTQLNFTLEGLEGAKQSVVRLNDFAKRMKEIAEQKGDATPEIREILKGSLNNFASHMANDLNISAALATIFDLMRDINIYYDKGKLTTRDAAEVLYLLQEFNRILGIFNFAKEESIPQELLDLLNKREEARRTKDFKTADACRNEIDEKGFRIEDTPHGARLKKK